MLGLDYSSSEEEPDEDSDNIQRQVSSDGKTSETSEKSMVNPFDAQNYDPSSSDEETQQCHSHSQVNLPKMSLCGSNKSKLPIESQLSLEQPINSKVSIFSNPFKEEENKELSQLERHVKLTDTIAIGGRPQENSSNKKKTICWSYHKYKKCKFGNRCRFLHNDTDFIDVNAIKRTDKSNKKRIGITDSLIPPKKAMKAYYSQQTN